MSVTEYTATSFEDAIRELYVDDWDPELSRYRSPYAFRGMVDANWDMRTSLVRLGGAYKTIEKHLLRNFKKYAHRDVVERESFWHWLTVAQHHGLPTRLLDWTYSPLVALHFATDDLERMTDDGVVWSAKIPEVHSKLPRNLGAELRKEGSYVFTVDMLARLGSTDFDVFGVSTKDLRRAGPLPPSRITTLDDFDRMKKSPFALFFEPPSIDDRIVNQFALFSVISDADMPMNKWLNENSSKSKKTVIPAKIKWEIRDKLDQANITERIIYPGLGGLALWLKRHYSPS
ncbi:FRG domain-containing protein [Mesorhizobium sp. ZC-5]|uniref:FRG domain-containing protein n=1 Tax=Mesorhizobium sp. ZC-5 TaxID=2986066 RepID=UPI0021E83A9E|nr:FRG domain-containing protein [Mesorhizobium sp. ZC-5]MCV3239098.1 FRG domain-containing protein [Mesorhizobium sp. ZC-5]